MRIAIVAAGAVGGFLATHLLRRNKDDIALVARGAHLEAIRRNGLVLTTDEGTSTFPVPLATDDPADIGAVDAVLFAVKLTDTESAAELCRPLLGPDTPVISFQNGVESAERISAVLGGSHACAGCCYVSATIDRPGVIRQTGGFARFLFAERDGSQSERTAALRDVLEASGVECPVADDIDSELWRKFTFLAALSGVTAAARTTVGSIRDDPTLATVYRRAIEEAAAVAHARGVRLAPDIVDRHIQFTDTLPAGMRASQAVDLEAGKPLEVEWLSGAVSRLGAACGVETPVNSTLYAVLKPFAAGEVR